jgi:hypothetical protein
VNTLRLAAPLSLLPGAAAAGAVCFGASDGAKGLSHGIWWGIVILLTTTMVVLGGLGWLLWTVEKNRRAAEHKG